MPDGINHRAFCSGDVLLSRGLSPYYHRGCSVSLPCSKWERVGPLRYYHQSAEPHWHFAAVAATQARSRISGDFCQSSLPNFERTGSSIGNRKSKIFTSSLASTYRKKKCDSRFIITIHELHGIGTALLTQLVRANPDHSTISISFVAGKPVLRLYERFGFKVVEQRPDAVVMHRPA